MWPTVSQLRLSVPQKPKPKPKPIEIDTRTIEDSVSTFRSIPTPTRTPMGDYIVPPGEKPLTSLGYPAPGPADYVPKIDLTRQSAPQYSVVGKTKKVTPKKCPGPADYRCEGDLKWKDRTITLKARVKGGGWTKEASAGDSNIGPANYNTEKPIGSTGPRYSMASKHARLDAHCSLVQPVDTHGFESPGPNYRPNSGYWGRGPKKSFGIKGPVFKDTIGPGPGDYNIPEPYRGPSYSLSSRIANPDEIKRAQTMRDPAPNTYDVGSTIGKAVAISMSSRRKEGTKVRRVAPAPNTYTLKNAFDKDYKGATMAYRWFDTNEATSPGPADYHVRHVNLKKDPEFSCRQRVAPPFPDSVRYIVKTASPGPGKYNIRSDIRHNDTPAFSVGSRPAVKTQSEDVPAPNQYCAEKFQKPGAARAPAFTMGKRFEHPSSKASPGPAAYNLQVTESGGPKYTMSKRLGGNTSGGSGPAPNSYQLASSQTNRGLRKNLGIKLKSRASPFVYSGFHNAYIAEPVAG